MAYDGAVRLSDGTVRLTTTDFADDNAGLPWGQTRTWTNDLKARKIRVNVISPGTIDTGVFVGKAELRDQFLPLIPMGRVGQPREIATVALFLACEDSSFITGIELFVDGGTIQV